MQTHFPEKESLRDVTLEELEQVRSSMSELVYRRARHVVTEDERVAAFKEACLRQDLKRMGELFVASHRSLQHDYEVSAVELDFLVDTAITMPGIYGARMTGGGFGGCTVNLVAPGHEDAFQEAIATAYEQKFQRKPTTIVCVPDEGACELE